MLSWNFPQDFPNKQALVKSNWTYHVLISGRQAYFILFQAGPIKKSGMKVQLVGRFGLISLETSGGSCIGASGA